MAKSNTKTAFVRNATRNAIDRLASARAVNRANLIAELLFIAASATACKDGEGEAAEVPDQMGEVKFRLTEEQESVIATGPAAAGMRVSAWRTLVLAAVEDPDRTIAALQVQLQQVRAVARALGRPGKAAGGR